MPRLFLQYLHWKNSSGYPHTDRHYALSHEARATHCFRYESYLYKLTFELIEGVVNEKAEGTGLPEKDKRFIADFYKYGFVGVMLDWIKDGMQEDYSTIVKKMSLTLHGNISNSIGNFLDEG